MGFGRSATAAFHIRVLDLDLSVHAHVLDLDISCVCGLGDSRPSSVSVRGHALVLDSLRQAAAFCILDVEAYVFEWPHEGKPITMERLQSSDSSRFTFSRLSKV